MIEIVTLFLGLLTGPIDLELRTGPETESIEIYLDGQSAAVLEGPPWSARIDLGPDPHTWELHAIAYGLDGRELARTVRWLNLPRDTMAADWIDGGPEVGGSARAPRSGARIAELRWESLREERAEEVMVTLAGESLEPIAAGASYRQFRIPPLAPGEWALLKAEISFPQGRILTLERVLSDRPENEGAVDTELTGIPIVGRRKSDPLKDRLHAARPHESVPLEIVAIEKPRGEVIVVAELEALPELRQTSFRIASQGTRRDRKSDRRGPARFRVLHSRPLDLGSPHQLFPISKPMALRQGTMPGLTSRIYFNNVEERQLLMEAVAVAGRRAAAGQRPRAVLLIVEDCARFEGPFSIAALKTYLQELLVPLVVWSYADPTGEGGLCESARHVAAESQYRPAFTRLVKKVRDQEILWVRGRVLPKQVRLTDPDSSWRLSGRSSE